METQEIAEVEAPVEPKPYVVRMTKSEWRNTPRDYKGFLDGQKNVLRFVSGRGTCIVPVEIVDR